VSGAPSPLALNPRSQSGHAGVRDGLEARMAILRGKIRERGTQKRRSFVRFFACEWDLSQQPPDAPLPDAVASWSELHFVLRGAGLLDASRSVTVSFSRRGRA